MSKSRGAVNIEYIILIVVGALAVVLGLGYLSTVMNDKHSSVAGELSEVDITLASGGGAPVETPNLPRVVNFAIDDVVVHDYIDGTLATAGLLIDDPTGAGKGTVFSTDGHLDPFTYSDAGYGIFIGNVNSIYLELGKSYTLTYEYYLADAACSYDNLFCTWYKVPTEYSAPFVAGTETIWYNINDFSSMHPLSNAQKQTWVTYTKTITPKVTGHHRIGLEMGSEWAGDVYLSDVVVTEN